MVYFRKSDMLGCVMFGFICCDVECCVLLWLHGVLVCSDVYVCVPVLQACSGCVVIDPGGLSCGVSCFDVSCCVELCFVLFLFLMLCYAAQCCVSA